MKRLITCMIVCALMLSCVNVVFADEVKEIVIDTDVPVFQDLTDGQSFKGSKDIYIADLSPVDCIVLKKGSGTVSFAGSTFSGYTEVTKKTDLSCINYALNAENRLNGTTDRGETENAPITINALMKNVRMKA